MKIKRIWAMPNSRTFMIFPIRKLIKRHLPESLPACGLVIDPFANNPTFEGVVTNDIDPQYDTDFHMDAIDFLKKFGDESVDMVLYDPPYSPRQVSEVYKKMRKTVNMATTQASYWSDQKKEIARIVRRGGKVITCGWNSGGIGEKYGFEIIEILLVPHGGWHNDTIVTVERKVRSVLL